MKRIIAFAICMTIAAVCFAQTDPVVGYWISVDDKTGKVTAGWQIYIENNVLYGKILSIADEPRGIIASECRERYDGFPLSGRVNQMQVAGTPWIYGLTLYAEGEWRGGRIIDPADGKDYGCRIIFRPSGSKANNRTFQSDTLEMRGNIGPFSRSQYWRKSDRETASNLWPD